MTPDGMTTDSAHQTSETITSDLLKFINSEVSVSPEEVRADTDLLLTGAVDSLGVVRITQWMEDELGMEIDPTQVTLENFQTIDRMVSFCQTSNIA